MSHRLHLTLMFLAEFAGFGIGAVVAIYLWVARPIDLSPVLMMGLFGAILLVAVMVPRTVFRRLVPARCPVEGCPGPARPEGSKPIVYRCRRCGHVLDTGWSESGSSHRH
jgi:hypothetical protein